MVQRWLVAVVGVPVLLTVLLVCPAWATMLLVCAIAGVAAYELLHTASRNITGGFCSGTIIAAVLLELAIYWQQALSARALPVSMVTVVQWLIVVMFFAVAVKTYGGEKPITFTDVAIGIVGAIVFPMMYSCIFLLRVQESFGKVYVLAPFFIAFIGDALSMYFGMWFGKRKLAKNVSPNKTWAGGIGGPIGSALGMCLLGLLGAKYSDYVPNYAALAAVGACANVFGQLGDLSLSLIKRENGIKDYSHLFLTHGGMLDRFDSSMFIAPVVYFFVTAGMI